MNGTMIGHRLGRETRRPYYRGWGYNKRLAALVVSATEIQVRQVSCMSCRCKSSCDQTSRSSLNRSCTALTQWRTTHLQQMRSIPTDTPKETQMTLELRVHKNAGRHGNPHKAGAKIKGSAAYSRYNETRTPQDFAHYTHPLKSAAGRPHFLRHLSKEGVRSPLPGTHRNNGFNREDERTQHVSIRLSHAPESNTTFGNAIMLHAGQIAKSSWTHMK